MRCLYPRTVGFKSDGKTICWSQKDYSKEYATFQLPCGKCIECRLEYARQWAVRCVHEAQMHENNCFITLTYSDENLISDKLYYVHFQEFVKRLRDARFRELLDQTFSGLDQKKQRKLWNGLSKESRDELYKKIKISVFVTGEYGEETQRPHWHALIFNWFPSDAHYEYSNDRKDKIYSSQILGPFNKEQINDGTNRLWNYGKAEFGSVTFESAGYCARYAAKKLVHGYDGSHEFEPISKKSSKQAIGASFLEKYWEDIFNYGKCEVRRSDGTIMSTPIPRYYEKWLKKNHPERWSRYVTETKQRIIQSAEDKYNLEREELDFLESERRREMGLEYIPSINRKDAERIILEKNFKLLQANLKL